MVAIVAILAKSDLQFPIHVEVEKTGQTLLHNANLAYFLNAGSKIMPWSLL